MVNKDKRKTAKNKNPQLSYDTRVGVIAEMYDAKLGVSSDTKLGDYLKGKGYYSLSEMLKV